jgi:hypothetical protein
VLRQRETLVRLMLPTHAGYSFQAAAHSTLNVSRLVDLRNAMARMLCRDAQVGADHLVPAYGPRDSANLDVTYRLAAVADRRRAYRRRSIALAGRQSTEHYRDNV